MGEVAKYASPGQFITTVYDDPEIGGDILDMGLFKKANPGTKLEGDVTAYQLHLQFHGLVVCSVENSHITKFQTLTFELHHPLGHEFRLPGGVAQLREHRFSPFFTNGTQLLGKLVRVVPDRKIGHLQDFRRTAVVRFQTEELTVRVAFREREDVSIIGAAKGIDTLRIVPYDHNIPVMDGEEIRDFSLQGVDILVFIYEDVQEPFGVIVPYLRKFPE